MREEKAMNERSDATRGTLRPSAATLFLRNFLPYQLYRFAWINLRMLAMIYKSHPRPGTRP